MKTDTHGSGNAELKLGQGLRGGQKSREGRSGSAWLDSMLDNIPLQNRALKNSFMAVSELYQ